VKAYWVGCILLAVAATATGQDSKELDKRVTDFTLANGLRFVILERHQAPLVSFQTYIGGGTLSDPAGQSGLAALVGRLAYKGTESVGTRNWAEERKALEAMDQAFDRMEAERNKGSRTNQEQFDLLRTQWRLAVDAAQRQGDPSEYGRQLTGQGATAVRAGANWNSLQSGYTLPSNRIEFWYQMESQRLMHPVLRDFDSERAAMIEEAAKSRSNPQGRLVEALQSAAFLAHPYRNPSAGWPSDLPELKRSEARDFVEKHYVPGNIVLALVGDVDPAEARRLAEKYFSPMPVRPIPPPIRTVEPAQLGPRTVQLDMPGQVTTAIGYKRPADSDRDDTVLDVIQSILGNGSSGMAWRELVQEKKVATGVRVAATFPDGRYPNLFLFVAAPAPGLRLDQLQKAIDELVGRLRAQKVDAATLSQAKAQTQSTAYARLASNATMAEMLALYASTFGDWKKLFTLIDDVEKVTAEDVQRAAQRYFLPTGRTTVFTSIPGMPAQGGQP